MGWIPRTFISVKLGCVIHLSKWTPPPQGWPKDSRQRKDLLVRIPRIPGIGFDCYRIPSQRSVFVPFVLSEWYQNVWKNCCCQSPLYGQTDPCHMPGGGHDSVWQVYYDNDVAKIILSQKIPRLFTDLSHILSIPWLISNFPDYSPSMNCFQLSLVFTFCRNPEYVRKLWVYPVCLLCTSSTPHLTLTQPHSWPEPPYSHHWSTKIHTTNIQTTEHVLNNIFNYLLLKYPSNLHVRIDIIFKSINCYNYWEN